MQEAKCILFIDYLLNGFSINGEYYAELLRQLRKYLKNEHPGNLTKTFLILILQLTSHLFKRLPYSALNRLINLSIFLKWLHLTINYYSTRQKHVDGNGDRNDDDVIAAVDDFFYKENESFFTNWVQALQHGSM